MSNRVLSFVLVAVVLGTIATLAYTIAVPKPHEKYSEFYALGLEGKAQDYPVELSVGEEARVVLVIANHEGETTNYRVQIMIEGEKKSEVGLIVLEDGMKWTAEAGFKPDRAGERQMVEFLLFKNGNSVYSDRLYFWVSVKQG